jgi:hypothetical protein
MYSNRIRLGIAAAIFSLCASSHASPVSPWGSWDLSFRSIEVHQSFATSFSAGAGVFGIDDQAKWAASDVSVDSGPFPNSAAQLEQFSATKHHDDSTIAETGLELALWNFIANIRAQKEGHVFELIRTTVTSIDYTLGTPVSAVPLPATAWLFLMGILAFCGSRIALWRKTIRPPAITPMVTG